MKTITLITMLIVSSVALNAQAQSYETKMTKALITLNQEMINNADYEKLALEFESIALSEQTQWLPYYYSSYCNITYAMNLNNPRSIAAQTDIASTLLNIADSLSPGNSEISCLKSLIATAYLIANAADGGYKYGEVINQALNEAEKEDPSNPRIYYLQAQSLMFTPPQYGGGYENAKLKLEIALEKYKAFEPKNEFYPSWGQKECIELLKGRI